MSWDKKGDDLGTKGPHVAPLAMGRWTPWSKEVIIAMAAYPYIGNMLKSGTVPLFVQPVYEDVVMVTDEHGREVAEAMPRPEYRFNDGITRYRGDLKTVLEEKRKFNGSCGRVASNIWGLVGEDVKTRIAMLLGGTRVEEIFTAPSGAAIVVLWRACQSASTGAGSDSMSAAFQNALSLHCAQHGVLAFSAEFAARKKEIIDLKEHGAMEWERVFHALFDAKYILEVMGKDPATNQQVAEETTKPVWTASELLASKLIGLINTAARFAQARQDGNALPANLAKVGGGDHGISSFAANVHGGAPGTRSRGACFNCGKAEHSYRHCPSPSAKCTICGEPHLDSMHAQVMELREKAKARAQMRFRPKPAKGAGGEGPAAGSPADRSRIKVGLADVRSPEAEAQYADYEALMDTWTPATEDDDDDVDMVAMSARLAEVEWSGDIRAHMVRTGARATPPKTLPVRGPSSTNAATPFGTPGDYKRPFSADADEGAEPSLPGTSWDPLWGEEY